MRGQSVPVQHEEEASRPARAAAVRMAADQGSMHLAAFTGIGLVLLLGAVFYLGTDSLRGSVTGGDVKTMNVTITKDGAFDPATVAIRPGDQLVITNENPDPQVLKPKGTDDLFSVQVLFDEPFSFVIPTSALGKSYVYFSETLPDTEVLQIQVVETLQQAVASSEASSEDMIPLPPILPTPQSSESSESTESSSSSSSSIPTVRATPSTTGQPLVVALISSSFSSRPPGSGIATGQPSTFSLRPAAASASSSLPSLTGNSNLPNNPYTVGNRTEAERLGLIPSSSSSSSLKSGAPLRRVETPVKTPAKVTKPRANVTTGPADSMVWVTLLTMGLIALYYRRVIAA